MAKKKEIQKPSWFNRIRRKARIIIVNTETFEEKRHFMLSSLNIIVFVLFFCALLISSTLIITAYTPLKRLIPGYPTAYEEQQLKEQDLKNIKFLDGLKQKSDVEELYYKNLALILSDKLPIDSDQQILLPNEDSGSNAILSKKISKEDSILRLKIDEREKYAVIETSNIIYSQREDLKGIFLFPPLTGSVSSSMNANEGHNGIDIIAPKDEAVKATLEGTVVFTDWTPENGHIIQIQHAHNLISIYKHNSFILKKVGEIVEAGEPIAIIGNTGELSTGTHLHFELWHNGTPLNPEDFITF